MLTSELTSLHFEVSTPLIPILTVFAGPDKDGALAEDLAPFFQNLQQVGGGSREVLLVYLGHFPSEKDRTPPGKGCEISEELQKAMRRFVEEEAPVKGKELLELPLSAPGLRGEKPAEEETIARHPADTRQGGNSRRPRNWDDRDSRPPDNPDEGRSGIADSGGSGITYEGQILPFSKERDGVFGAGGLVLGPAADGPDRHADTRKQLSGPSGVFAEDGVHRRERFPSPKGQIRQISDRRADNIQGGHDT